MTEPIFAAVEHDLERGWDAFRSHLHHGHYHDPEAAATPATEAPMSLVSTLEADYAEVVAKVRAFATDKLPAVVADAKKLEGSPVVAALLKAIDGSVPLELLHSMVLPIIDGLVDAYAPESGSQTPAAPADPAVPVQAEPQPEPAPATA